MDDAPALGILVLGAYGLVGGAVAAPCRPGPWSRRCLPYRRLFRIRFACGVPAFAVVLAIFWLMLARPPLG